MRYKSIVVCETCIVDAHTNNISIINLFEDITAFGFPIVIPQITISVWIEREDGEVDESIPIDLRIKINDKELFSRPFKAEFKGKRRTRLLISLQRFIIEEAGLLEFIAFQDNREVLKASINVTSPPQKEEIAQAEQR